MQQLQPNTTLQGGKYRIVRVLGQGGFGITYLAVQTSLGRYVAVKEFFMKELSSRNGSTSAVSTPSGTSSWKVEQYRKKFIKEAQNLAKLHHPNIISVIEVFKENDTVYYSMPYLPGGSLQDYVKTHGPLFEKEATHYIRQIARALKYMHEEEHICHYDVKPSNILLDEKGDAILIDFGISKNYDESGHETSGTPVGRSEGYAPIEQYEQNVDEFSPASDVYALGATLLFAMTGQRPTSVIERVGGAPITYPRYCSGMTRYMIDSSMKIRKDQRPRSVDIFLNGYPQTPSNVNPYSPQLDERTYSYSPAESQKYPNMNSVDESTLTSQSNNHSQSERRSPYKPVILPQQELPKREPSRINTAKETSFDFTGIYVLAGIVAFWVVGLLYNWDNWVNSSDQDNHQNAIQTTKTPVQTIKGLYCKSTLGDFKYTGPLDDNSKPNGRGEAFFTDGRYYKGYFDHGNLTGKDAYFEYGNGDTFVGEFRNNSFYYGTYTIAKDKSYFKGYYKKGQPNGGNWYDKNGNPIQ